MLNLRQERTPRPARCRRLQEGVTGGSRSAVRHRRRLSLPWHGAL